MDHRFKNSPLARIALVLISMAILTIAIFNTSQAMTSLAPQSILQLIREHLSGLHSEQRLDGASPDVYGPLIGGLERDGGGRVQRFSNEWSDAYFKIIAERIVGRMIGMGGVLARHAEDDVAHVIRGMADIPDSKKGNLIIAIHREFSARGAVGHSPDGAWGRGGETAELAQRWHGTVVQQLDQLRRKAQERLDAILEDIEADSVSLLICSEKDDPSTAGSAMAHALRIKHKAMLQAFRKSALISDVVEVDSPEHLMISARRKLAKGKKLVVIDISIDTKKRPQDSPLIDLKTGATAGVDYCVLNVIGRQPIVDVRTFVPLVDMHSLFRLGMGILHKDKALISLAYEQSTGNTIGKDIVDDIIFRNRWFLSMEPRYIPVSTDRHGYDLMRKIFEVSV